MRYATPTLDRENLGRAYGLLANLTSNVVKMALNPVTTAAMQVDDGILLPFYERLQAANRCLLAVNLDALAVNLGLLAADLCRLPIAASCFLLSAVCFRCSAAIWRTDSCSSSIVHASAPMRVRVPVASAFRLITCSRRL